MIPRPYQVEALDALHRHVCEKETNPCLVLPTGSGKSALIAWSIKRWKEASPHFRVVILAHRKELVSQNAGELKGFYLDEGNFTLASEIGIFSASLKQRDYESSILFASIDSIYKKSGEFTPFDVIMVDEAHRIPPGGEGKYITFLKGCRQFNSELRIIGWTATPYRMGCGLICHKDHLLNEVCYEAALTDLIKDGYLCQLRSKIGVTVPQLKGVKRYGKGDYVLTSLAKATNCSSVIEKAIEEAVRIISAEERYSVLFFCVNVEHCKAVSQELSRYGIHAPAVTGKTPVHKRDRIAEEFKSGKLRAVCNVNVYTEGFNATCVDCIVLLRPTLSPGLFSQMVGRGLRLHDNKRDCLVLDFAQCIEEHGPVDLLGGDRTVMATCSECRESFSKVVRKCPQCGWVIPKQEMERLEAEAERKRQMHGEKASSRSILSGVPEVFEVSDVFIGRHRKEGMPDSLLVRYRCGLRVFREWICLDHEGYAGRKAQEWWLKRFGRSHNTIKARIERITVSGALENLFTLQTIREFTKTITVRVRGKYKEIIAYNEKAGLQSAKGAKRDLFNSALDAAMQKTAT